jgi:hypothetical protein
VTLRLRRPTKAPIRAHGTPRRWSSEIRRWRRSCGDHSGIPSALQAFAIDVRSASAPDSAKRRCSGFRNLRFGSVASIAWASSGEASGEQEVSANPHAAPLDKIRARGIPIVGRVSGGGAIPGTQPWLATLKKLGE